MKIKIHTIIVDNMPKITESIQAVFIKRNKELDNVEYILHPFKDENHFKDSKRFILNCITANQTIDLMFCDYNLDGGHNGIELFNLFIGTSIRPYKILHSFTDQTLEDHLDEKDIVWDTFSKSKTPTKIKENIIKFEENILKIKQEGNPNIENEVEIIEKIELERVTYAYSLNEKGNEFCIGLRNENLEINEFKSSNIKWGAKNLNRNCLNFYTVIALNDNKFYNKAITINLKWVSHIDTVKKEIHIITPDSRKFVISYSSFKNYNIADEDNPSVVKTIENTIIEKIERNIPSYFYK